jgi:F0F1-type ATP synthase membrane subunit c/vacuolar-type H+-ATPase subunit K
MFDSRKIKALLIGCGLLAAGGAIPVAAIAEGTAAVGVTQIQAEQSTFDDVTIEAFAEAQVRIGEIRAAYQPAFQAAETEEQRQQINQQAMQEMIDAVEATPNLTLDTFYAVTDAVAQDPELAERINEAISASPT